MLDRDCVVYKDPKNLQSPGRLFQSLDKIGLRLAIIRIKTGRLLPSWGKEKDIYTVFTGFFVLFAFAQLFLVRPRCDA